MPIADTRKVQTMINVVATQMEIIRAAVGVMNNVKTVFTTVNPDVTNTPLEGNLTIVNNALTALNAEVDKAVWDAMIAAKVPTHANDAMIEDGFDPSGGV